ncbi:hypothetical protein B0H14DRAFT_2637925 [Mycena olivaceomarginata]|nr:hypothetical protein B0H14DRAFT_2637925 [Mycena olivaceomarginata]
MGGSIRFRRICAGTQIVFFDQSALLYCSSYEVQMTIHRPAVHTDDTGGGADVTLQICRGCGRIACLFRFSFSRYSRAARDTALECLEREAHRVTSAYEQRYHGGEFMGLWQTAAIC